LERFAQDLAHVLPVLEYEWARLRARQVIEEGVIEEGVDPGSSGGALVAGAGLVSAPFDLRGLLDEIDRLARSRAPVWLFASRARPARGRFQRVIFPHGRTIVEAEVDDGLFEMLSEALRDREFDTSRFGDAAAALRSAGLLADSVRAGGNA
jgi:hypothetical protein